jgi:hypothetical protein
MDPSLVAVMNVMTEMSALRDRGVTLFAMSPEPLSNEFRSVMYLLRPNPEILRMVADHIHARESSGSQKDYSIVFVPKRTFICDRILEECGVTASISEYELHMDIIPLDDDLFTLELRDSYRDCFVDGDWSALTGVANALMRLQTLNGFIPQLRGKGACAKSVISRLLRMRRELSAEDEAAFPVTPQIDSILIIDRDVDMVTPLLTQLTYEGLVDESFGIRCGYVELELDIAGTEQMKQKAAEQAKLQSENKAISGPMIPKRIKTPLNSNDRLFAEIRDVNFSALGPRLNRRARELDEQFKERHAAQTVSQIRDFMRKLGSLQQEHNALRVRTCRSTQ